MTIVDSEALFWKSAASMVKGSVHEGIWVCDYRYRYWEVSGHCLYSTHSRLIIP